MTYEQEQALLGSGNVVDNIGDVDGDGIPNVWEYFLCSDPNSDDTDSDGLKDGDEWSFAPKVLPVGVERTNFHDITVDDFARAQALCNYAVNCTLDTTTGLKIGTSVRNSDTDADTLSDKLETDGWDVWLLSYDNGTRVDPYHVTSDPLLPDTDKDGVSDKLESTNKTDPRKLDTDSDGTSDSVESSQADRNPIEPDIAFTIRLQSLVVLENGDNSDGFNKAAIGAMEMSNIHLYNKGVVNEQILNWKDIAKEIINNVDSPSKVHGRGIVDDSCGSAVAVWDNDFLNFNPTATGLKSKRQVLNQKDIGYLSFSIGFEYDVVDGFLNIDGCENNEGKHPDDGGHIIDDQRFTATGYGSDATSFKVSELLSSDQIVITASESQLTSIIQDKETDVKFQITYVVEAIRE